MSCLRTVVQAGALSLPPGDYVMACFVPVGSTADGQIDHDAPPHFTLGMKHTFTIEASRQM